MKKSDQKVQKRYLKAQEVPKGPRATLRYKSYLKVQEVPKILLVRQNSMKNYFFVQRLYTIYEQQF